MEKRTIKIRGMVCRRCLAVVNNIFSSQGLYVCKIGLGEVTFHINESQEPLLEIVSCLLLAEGLEIVDAKQIRIIAKVKELVSSFLTNRDNNSSSFSNLLNETLHLDYGAVSSLFSAIEGLTLEKYIIERRMQKVGEMLIYTSLSLTDIAYALGFSSVHHLSNQFKSNRGLSPSEFRRLKAETEESPKNSPSPEI